MSTAAVTPKKPGPAKKVKTYGYITVDKNSYTKDVNALVAKGATIVAITANGQAWSTFDVHYFTQA